MSAVRKIDPVYQQPNTTPKRRVPARPPQKRMKKAPKTNPFLSLFVVLGVAAVFALGLFILRGYANITTVRAELSKQEMTIDELEKRVNDLTVQVESIKSSSKIEESAMYKLGLVYPDESQMVAVSVPEPSVFMPQETSDATRGRVKTVLRFFSGAF